MTLLEKLRNKAFWAIDSLKGGAVRKSLDLLEEIEGVQGKTDEELSSYREEALGNLLRHCVETVPAYRNLASTLQSTALFTQWPVVNKMMLKEGGEKYLSNAFAGHPLIAMTTSGSTGTPFTNWQDIGKKKHVNAEVLHYNGKIGYEIGRKIIYFRSIVTEVSKSPLQQWMQNISLLDCTDLSDEGIKNKLTEIRKLSQNGGAMILSYASTLDAFRRYFDKYGIEEAKDCRIYGIVSGSEMLQDVTRETLEKAFRCKVVSRYSNEENGFLGQDDKENNVFIPNRANYYIEILKMESDEPADEGEVGRIIVTDLYNYAMPMVRYDTGDVGAWKEVEINGAKRLAIGNFGGRRVDVIYDCKGAIISPHSITNNMWHFPDIKQFQFIQRAPGTYTLKINSDNPIREEELIAVYHRVLGNEANIEVERCDEIPVLASGKRRYIVNQMNTPKQ